ncbi:MAG TPA: M13 family metallopeptidase [Sphingobacterium sp.]|nr:M13 family metallopeptidase [Sphingobacterium sp.]
MRKYFLLGLLFVGAYQIHAQEQNVINPEYMDKTVRPQDDFYNFVNGNWMKNTEIPSDKARWGSFDELREHTDESTLKLLNTLLEEKHTLGSDGQKIGDLYNSFIDFDKRNELGIEPVKPYLAKIKAISNLSDLYEYLVEVTPVGGNPFFGSYVYSHMKNSDINAVYIGAASLGLGRSYYQKEDDNNKETLEKYSTYVSDLFGLALSQKNRDIGDEIVSFEKKIASFLKTIEESRDAQKRYNPVAVKDLPAMVSHVNLTQYLEDTGFKADTVIISEINYIQKLDEIINEENIPVIKDFLMFNLLNDATSYLTKDLNELSFDFYGRQLRGQKEQRSLDKRGLEFVNGTVGELMGKLYVAEYFPTEAKEVAAEMVDYLIKAFEVRINNLSWMSADTKVKALEKLSKFNVKIGYPDKWKDYSKLNIGNSLFENVESISRWSFEENRAKQDKPVDKTEWAMSPQTVNAYYSPLYNEIVFPAAILQSPFYDYKADIAVNFGGIGAVIGHELSHGFDDSGAHYDGDGNLNDWWTPEDKEQFDAAANALVAQFDAYEPVPGVNVNGKFTLGENIGDLGGTAVAFEALKMYLKDHGDPGLLDGYDQVQRFFMSWATIWRTKSTDEYVINQVKTDPHSPAQYRSIGPILNMDAFHEAFQTEEGDEMYVPKENRIEIW